MYWKIENDHLKVCMNINNTNSRSLPITFETLGRPAMCMELKNGRLLSKRILKNFEKNFCLFLINLLDVKNNFKTKMPSNIFWFNTSFTLFWPFLFQNMFNFWQNNGQKRVKEALNQKMLLGIFVLELFFTSNKSIKKDKKISKIFKKIFDNNLPFFEIQSHLVAT